MSEITLTYRGVEIDPAPLLENLTQEYIRTGANEIIGCKNVLSFQGYYIAQTGSTSELIEKHRQYKELFSCCGDLEILCDGSPIFSASVTPVSFPMLISDNNLVISFPYTVSFEYMDTGVCCSPTLTNKKDTWAVSRVEDCDGAVCAISGFPTQYDTYAVEHSVSASSLNECGGRLGWEIAKEEVDDLLTTDIDIILDSILGSGCLTNKQVFNKVRRVNVDVSGGSYSVDESFLVREQDTGTLDGAKESLTVEISRNQSSRLATVSISGNIEGYEINTYNSGCKAVSTCKYDAAKTYFDQISPDMHTRAQNLSGLTLSPRPISYTYGHNPCEGRINYAYVFNNNSLCFNITGDCSVLSEAVTISTNNPRDIYGEDQIIGRPCALLTELGVKSKGSKTVNINLVLDCGEPCDDIYFYLLNPQIRPQVELILDEVFSELTGSYGSVYTDNDSEDWDPKNGIYNRSVTFSYSSCCTGE